MLGLVSLATVTGLYFWLDVPLVAAAFTYLVVLVLLSLVSNLFSLIVLSFIGVGCLRSEQALRESEYKLRQIIETEPGLTWSTGSDGSEGKKAEVQPGFLAQVRAILNVLPAYTWYAPPAASPS